MITMKPIHEHRPHFTLKTDEPVYIDVYVDLSGDLRAEIFQGTRPDRNDMPVVEYDSGLEQYMRSITIND